MTVIDALSNSEVTTSETSIRSGQTELIADYILDALKFHLLDLDELKRRAKFSLDYCDGEYLALHWVATLMAVIEDRTRWEFCLNELDESVQVRLGYISYQYLMKRTSFDQKVSQEWAFLLELSAKKGHLHAKRLLFERKIEKFRLCSIPIKLIANVFFTLKGIVMFIRDPVDQRLPKIGK